MLILRIIFKFTVLTLHTLSEKCSLLQVRTVLLKKQKPLEKTRGFPIFAYFQIEADILFRKVRLEFCKSLRLSVKDDLIFSIFR